MDFLTIDLSRAELKFADDGSAFTGYASVFGGVDSHGDTIHQGAYTDVLNTVDTVKMYFNHGWLKGEMPIGKMKLSQDAVGLKVERAEFTPGLRLAQDVSYAAKHGTVDGLSIGFRPDPETTKRKSEGRGRDIYRIAYLKEVSVVDWPSDGAARMSDVKSAIDEAESFKEVERLLRDAAGFTRSDACALVARVKFLTRGERDVETAGAEEIRRLFQRFNAGDSGAH